MPLSFSNTYFIKIIVTVLVYKVVHQIVIKFFVWAAPKYKAKNYNFHCLNTFHLLRATHSTIFFYKRKVGNISYQNYPKQALGKVEKTRQRKTRNVKKNESRS